MEKRHSNLNLPEILLKLSAIDCVIKAIKVVIIYHTFISEFGKAINMDLSYLILFVGTNLQSIQKSGWFFNGGGTGDPVRTCADTGSKDSNLHYHFEW